MENRTILDTLDPEVFARVASRRDALLGMSRAGLGLALASVPIALTAMAKSAFAQGGLPQQVVDILKYALTLERLEASFYVQGVGSQIAFPAGVKEVFTIIRDHEVTHVEFLENALTTAGVSLADVPSQFDFTAGDMFGDVFTNYGTFVTLSTAFEDTGVRAYKGQAPKLLDADTILTAALTIHSVEARHASKVRRLAASYAQQGWIPFTQPGAPAAVAPVYAGMGETVKYDVNVPQVSGVSAESVTEAFDEELTMEAVLQIVAPFIKS